MEITELNPPIHPSEIALPTLLDHAPYAECCERIRQLEQQAEAARQDHTNYANTTTRSGAESHDDESVEAGVQAFFKEEETRRKNEIKAQIRLQAVERALKAEREKAVVLWRDAYQMVLEHAKPIVDHANDGCVAARELLDRYWAQRKATQRAFTDRINEQLPGKIGHGTGAELWTGVPHSKLFGSPNDHADSFQAGARAHQLQVHDPAVKQFGEKERAWSGLAGRFESFLNRFQ